MLQLKDTDWLNGYKNKTHIYAVYKSPTSNLETHSKTGWKKIFHAQGNKKLFRQAKVKRIQYHQTSFTINVKGIYTVKKYKRRKRSTESTPNH